MGTVRLITQETHKTLFGSAEANTRGTADRKSSGGPRGGRRTLLALLKMCFKALPPSSHTRDTLQMSHVLILTRRKPTWP